jgi:hypothetical protein
MGWGHVFLIISIYNSELVLFLITVPTHAEKRAALVIGNAAYKNAATLQKPRNDAQDVTAALKRLGFETISDLDKVGIALTRGGVG